MRHDRVRDTISFIALVFGLPAFLALGIALGWNVGCWLGGMLP